LRSDIKEIKKRNSEWSGEKKSLKHLAAYIPNGVGADVPAYCSPYRAGMIWVKVSAGYCGGNLRPKNSGKDGEDTVALNRGNIRAIRYGWISAGMMRQKESESYIGEIRERKNPRYRYLYREKNKNGLGK
jgi:hypothetical protein